MFKRIAQNSGSNVLKLFVRIIITLVMTPIILHALGRYDYGIWEIIAATIGYMGLLDLGMKPTVTRHAARYIGEKSPERLKELFATSFIFMSCVGALLCFVFIIWSAFGSDFLSESGEHEERYVYFLLILAFQMLVTFPGYVAECFIFGFQKHVLNNLLMIVHMIIGAAVTYYFINENNALIVVAIVPTINLTIRYSLLYIILAKRKDMQITLKFSSASISMLKHLIKFGSKSLIQGIGSVVENRSSLILIGWLLGPASVVFYAIPLNLTRYIQAIAWSATNTFMPLFSDLYARDENEKILDIFLKYSRYLIGGLVLFGLCVYVFGNDFIELWIGAEYTQNGQLLIGVLIIYFLLPFLIPFGSQYLLAKNKHGILAIISPIIALVSIITSALLIHFYGVIGAAFGALIPICFSTPYLLRHVCKDLGISSLGYLKETFLPVIMPAILLVIAINILQRFHEIYNYVDLLLQAVVAILVSVSTFYFMVLNGFERKKVNRIIISRVIKKSV